MRASAPGRTASNRADAQEDSMKLKTIEIDGKTYAEVADGNPVYVHDDGREVPFDAAATVSTIRARNAEAKQHRERAEAAESALKAFEGIDDADAARKALATVQNLDHKKLVDAGEVERLKGEINKTWQEKLDAESKRAQQLEQQLHNEIVGGSFARSKFIAEKLAIPADLVQASFGARFKVEDGKLRAFDANGNAIVSRKNPGEPADFEEAIEALVDAYPHKDSILKADNKAGSGAPGNGGGGGGSKSISRAAFDALDPAGRIAHVQGGGTVTD